MQLGCILRIKNIEFQKICDLVVKGEFLTKIAYSNLKDDYMYPFYFESDELADNTWGNKLVKGSLIKSFIESYANSIDDGEANNLKLRILIQHWNNNQYKVTTSQKAEKNNCDYNRLVLFKHPISITVKDGEVEISSKGYVEFGEDVKQVGFNPIVVTEQQEVLRSFINWGLDEEKSKKAKKGCIS